jgi:hypothetical protein
MTIAPVEGVTRRAPKHRVRGGRWRLDWLLVAWLAIGLVIRILLFRTALARVDADEATGMLMAARASSGHAFAFFWDANYGGTLTTWIEAPFVAIFGLHLVVFRVLDTAFTLVDVLLLRAVVARLAGPRAGTVAAGVWWVFPPSWVWWSSHEYVFWVPAIGLALATVWLCLRWAASTTETADRQDRWLWLIGLAAGATYWEYPLLVCVIGPALLAVAWNLRRRPVAILKAVPLAVVGGAPWLYTNLTHHFESLHHPLTGGDSFGVSARHAVTRVLPAVFTWDARSLGITSRLRFPTTAHLVWTGLVIFLAVLAFTVWHIARRHVGPALVGVSILVWPVILAVAHVPEDASGYRYGLVVVPALVAIVAYLVSRFRFGPLVTLAAATAATLTVSSVETSGFSAALAWPAEVPAVVAYLSAHGETHPWAGYWEAGPIAVESDQRVLASSTSPIRDQLAAAEASRSPRSTYVVSVGGPLDQQLRQQAPQHGGAARHVIGGFAVYEFSSRVEPTDLQLAGDI